VIEAANLALWEWVAVVYFSYLTIVSFSGRRFARARWPTFVATVVCSASLIGLRASDPGPMIEALLPVPILFVGYRLSGLFFVRPMLDLERWLLRVDEQWLGRTGILPAYGRAPQLVREYFELAYLLVYAVVPAGAILLLLGGHPDAVPRFWAVSLGAEFVSYAMLPWLQTRPPRVLEIEGSVPQPPTLVRRFNLTVLNRGSIHANTIPSGHAAGAAAVALAVSGSMPLAGTLFLVLGASIVAGSVLGRYHYLVDSVLGVIVALGTWLLIGVTQ
jgi:membrane-associated phospholipid phosphatase